MNFLLKMEPQQNQRNFFEEMFIKNCEMIIKYNKEFTHYFSTLVNQEPIEHNFNYEDTYRKLSLYENTISSLNTQLELLKKENTLLNERLQMNRVNLSDNKEKSSIKEDTQELKRLLSIIKGEVHDIRNFLGKAEHLDEHE